MIKSIVSLDFSTGKDIAASVSKILVLMLAIYLLIITPILMYVWSGEPEKFNVREITQQMSEQNKIEKVAGSHMLAATIHISDTLLNKSGGYMSNDIVPPAIFMDNITNWELGVVEIQRVMTWTLKKDLSRSQSQSIEVKSLNNAHNHYNINHTNFMFPNAEVEYAKAQKELNEYMNDMSDSNKPDIQFYSRADNLADLLVEFSSKLGSLSQKLSASTSQGTVRENTDLANDATAKQSTETASKIKERTPWSKIDDVFYESRGQTWAMLHILKAVKHDFDDVLSKKNAHPSLNQIIKELEDTQEPVRAIFIMNGGGFGTFANHSLVMANYISRADSAIINLISLLRQG